MLLLQPPFKRNHIPFHHNIIIIYRYKYVVRFFSFFLSAIMRFVLNDRVEGEYVYIIFLRREPRRRDLDRVEAAR